MQTIEKLMICAIRCGQSTPKVRATSATGFSPASARNKKWFITLSQELRVRSGSRSAPAFNQLLSRRRLHEEQGIEHDGFREGDGQNRLDQDLRGRARIPTDGFRG